GRGFEPARALQCEIGHHPDTACSFDADARGVSTSHLRQRRNQIKYIVNLFSPKLLNTFSPIDPAVLSCDDHVAPIRPLTEKQPDSQGCPFTKAPVTSTVRNNARIFSRRCRLDQEGGDF